MQKRFADQYNSFTTNKGNIIWCGGMSLAWKDFIDVNTKKPLVFKTNKSQVQKQIDNFNYSPFTYHDIDENNIYLKTGHGEQTQSLINKQVKDKFKNYSFPDLNYKLQPSDIISFAYIFKKITFDCKFQKKNTGFLFNGLPAKSFQAVDQIQKKQIKVIQYKNRERFCIKINDRLTNDSLYLIKNSKISTVDKVIDTAIQAQIKGGDSLKKKDLFQMPIIDLSVMKQYKQLVGLKFENPELRGYILSVMFEALKLRVDQTGALLENRAFMFATKCATLKKQQPRQFILDKTFWLVMKEQGNHPYLCIQVRNPIDTQ